MTAHTDLIARRVRFSDWYMGIASMFALPGLAWSFGLSVAQDVPRLGLAGYLTGPIFTHKVSEFVIAAAWMWVTFTANHEAANLWPRWLTPERRRLVWLVSVPLVLWATVLATYAWTILNLGTCARSTNLDDPPGLDGEGSWVWRYYLGAVVVFGGAQVLVALRKLVRGPQVVKSDMRPASTATAA